MTGDRADSLEVFRGGWIPLGRGATVLAVRQEVLVLQLPRAANRRRRRGLDGRGRARRRRGRGRRRSTVEAHLRPGRLQAAAGCRRRRRGDGGRRRGQAGVILVGGAGLEQPGGRFLGLAGVQDSAVHVATKDGRRPAAEAPRHSSSPAAAAAALLSRARPGDQLQTAVEAECAKTATLQSGRPLTR